MRSGDGIMRARRSDWDQAMTDLQEGPPDPEVWYSRLYVAGSRPSRCEHSRTSSGWATTIWTIRTRSDVDLLQSPTLAQGDEILAVSTLVRRLPAPMRKVIGDFSDEDRVLVGLQLRAKHSP